MAGQNRGSGCSQFFRGVIRNAEQFSRRAEARFSAARQPSRKEVPRRTGVRECPPNGRKHLTEIESRKNCVLASCFANTQVCTPHYLSMGARGGPMCRAGGAVTFGSIRYLVSAAMRMNF